VKGWDESKFVEELDTACSPRSPAEEDQSVLGIRCKVIVKKSGFEERGSKKYNEEVMLNSEDATCVRKRLTSVQ
jgi:hypothetical protein